MREAILDAAGDLLLTAGATSFTIERLASQAGVSKMTIYKWWPSKGALALDGYFHAVSPALAFPDSGDVVTDLTDQITAFVRLVTQTPAGRVIAELIGMAQTDPDLAAAYRERYSGPRRELAVAAIRRGQDRGQLLDDLDAEAMVDQLWGACYHRLLIPDQPLTEQFARTLVTQLMHGVAVRDVSGS